MKTPNFEAFAKDVMKYWPEGFDIDAADLQEMAIKHGLLQEVEGGFDPEQHEDDHGCAEPGDSWFMYTYQGADT
jgi:hypothetical protein